jgi:type II secretory pathway pseudopilin PulG
MIKLFKQKKTAGFTLVETLVAISIFTISILALVSVLAQGISDTTYAKTKMTSTYLAQEGIEYMRNMRDTFVLYYDPNSSQNGWNAFLAGLSVCSPNGCYFDDGKLMSGLTTSDIPLSACQATGCQHLLYDPTLGVYDYASGSDSGIVRRIDAKIIDPNNNEVRITSTVYWTQGSGVYNISFSEDLFNWRE